MNSYESLEVLDKETGKGTGTYRFVCNGKYAVGYCAGWKEYTNEELDAFTERHGDRMATELKKGQKEREAKGPEYKAKYHSEGHPTKLESDNCYRRYELDHARWAKSSSWHGCKFKVDGEKCDKPTKNFVEVGHTRIISLCDEHNNMKCLEAVFSPYEEGGRRISSSY